MEIGSIVQDLMCIVLAGTISGLVTKRLGVSMLVGYLLVGAVIGRGGLNWVAQPAHELEMIAEAGALLLLFSVGLEFSFGELAKLGRYFLVGGGLQMVSIAVPLTLVARAAGLPWPGAVLAGAAGSLSSTVLVFRALTEAGQTESPHGRRSIAVLLFQDVALVPLLLLVPLLTGEAGRISAFEIGLLSLKAFGFLAGVWGIQRLVDRFGVPLLAASRSVELLVLSTITLLLGLCWVAWRLGLPPAVGAFAAGLALSENRLSKQIDSTLLPFRETFAAVFFVSLGMLLRPGEFLREPVLLTAGLIGMTFLKTAGAALALRAVGLSNRAAIGMGLGLAQLGEFSFLLVARGVAAGLIDAENYNRMLFIAVASLVATPWLIRVGLKLAGEPASEPADEIAPSHDAPTRAAVVGLGPIGGLVAARLETMGLDVALIDHSPVNLHPYAQSGFATFAGDARDPRVLGNADMAHRQLAVVCIPDDEVALEVVRALKQARPDIDIIVRCRYQTSAAKLTQAGAATAVSEEREAAGRLLSQCERWLSAARA